MIPPARYTRERFDGSASEGLVRIPSVANARIVVERPIEPGSESGCEADLVPKVVRSAAEAVALGLTQASTVEFTRDELVVFGAGGSMADKSISDAPISTDPKGGRVATIAIDHTLIEKQECCQQPHPLCNDGIAVSHEIVDDRVDWRPLQIVYRVPRGPGPVKIELTERTSRTCNSRHANIPIQ